MRYHARDLLNIPNTLSLLRIGLVPLFIYLFFSEQPVAATIVLVVSGLTDCVDGFVARHFNKVTEIGKILDPIADKLTQAAVAVVLSIQYTEIAALLAIFIVKELLMLLGSIKLFKSGVKPSAAQWWGKLATIVFYATMVAVVAFGSGRFGFTLGGREIRILVSIAAVFMIFSFINYIPVFFKLNSGKNTNEKQD